MFRLWVVSDGLAGVGGFEIGMPGQRPLVVGATMLTGEARGLGVDTAIMAVWVTWGSMF